MEGLAKRKYYKKWWFWGIGLVIIAVSMITPPARTFMEKTDKTGPITPPAALESGTYQIGTDITAGEYAIITDKNAIVKTYEFNGLVNINYLDITGTERIIVTLIKNQYLQINAQSCMIYPINEAAKTEIKDNNLTPGMYKVGRDIPAGKYKMYNYTFAWISYYSDSTYKNKIFDDYSSRSIELNLTDGQIIQVAKGNVKCILDSTSSKLANSYKSGTYTVGKDIEPGEYVFLADDTSKQGLCRTPGKGSFYNYIYFTNRTYITLSNGAYINVSNSTFYKLADAPKVTMIDCILPEGMYKIGIDIPAGKYKIKSRPDSYGTYKITNNSEHLTYGGYTFGDSSVSVANGEYLTIEDGYIIIN